MTDRCGRSFTDQDFSGLEKIADAGMEKQAILPLIPLALSALGVGTSLYDAYKSVRRGEYGRALGNVGLAALSVVPGLGAVGKGLGAAGKSIPWLGKTIGYAGRVGQAGKDVVGAARAAMDGTRLGRYASTIGKTVHGAATAVRGAGGKALQYGVNNGLITNGMANFARNAPASIGRAAKWTGKEIAAPAVGWRIADKAINGRAYAGAEANANYYVPGYGYQGYGVNGY